MKWEKGKNWNVGIDFSLFNYRLNGSVNYYSRKQQDLLGVYDVALPPNGASQSFVNVGTMKNTGVEIELDWNAVKSKNFNYTISFVGSTSNNKFVSFSNQFYEGPKYYWMSNFPLYPGNPGVLQRIEEGECIGNFYTFQYAGLDDNGGWLIYSKDGEVIPIDKGTDEDKRVVGNGLPKFTMSVTHTFPHVSINTFSVYPQINGELFQADKFSRLYNFQFIYSQTDSFLLFLFHFFCDCIIAVTSN